MAVTANEFRALAVQEVEIAGFGGGDRITVKLKPVSIMGLVKRGDIPNALIGKAIELFEGKTKKDNPEDVTDGFSKMAGIIDIMCMETMVEPTYAEVGDLLTDEQRLEIYTFAQGGVDALKSFRNE